MSSDATGPGDPLVSQFADQQDMLALIASFVDGLPSRLTEIEAALSGGDLELLSQIAHRLKGAGGGYGFKQITNAAHAVEESAKAAAEVATLREQVSELTSLCRRAVATQPPAG